MLPRPPPAHIALLTKANGANWTTQVRNHIILNGFDAVLAPVKELPASWLDSKPSTSNSEGGIASATADSTPPSPLLHQAGPRLPYDVEEFLLNFCDIQTQKLTHRRRGINPEARFYSYADPYDTPVESSPSTSSGIRGAAASSGAVPAKSPAPPEEGADAEGAPATSPAPSPEVTDTEFPGGY